jgi:hypothetical protein
MENQRCASPQIFYAQIGAGNSPPHFDLYAVDNCTDDEGVGGGTVPGFPVSSLLTGSTAIAGDMVGNSTYGITAQCFRGPHTQ